MYKTLNSMCTRTFFFVINGIQSKYFLLVHSCINNVPLLFEQNICYYLDNQQLICCYLMLLH